MIKLKRDNQTSNMKKLFLLLLFIPLVSCQDVEVRKTYYDSGELRSTATVIVSSRKQEAVDSAAGNYVDYLKQGEAKFYWKSGELKSTKNYVDGLRQGEEKEYYESGELRRTENFVDDLRQGEWKWYYETGKLRSTGNYVDGIEQ